MRTTPVAISLLLLALLGCPHPWTQPVDLSWIEYPQTKRVEVVDSYYDVEVADPYRWLEDESSPQTQGWLTEQDRITERFFAQLPSRQRFLKYLETNWLEGSTSVPVQRGQRVFYWGRREGTSHPVLYRADASSPPRAIFDLNQRDPEGRLSTLPSATVSESGRYVTYEVHRDGADIAEVRIYDNEQERELDDVLAPAFTAVGGFTADETALIYSTVELASMVGHPPTRPPGVYLHSLGTAFEDDTLLYRRPWDGMYMAGAVPADNGRDLWLLDMNVMGSRGSWGVRRLTGSDDGVRWLTAEGVEPTVDYRFAFVGEHTHDERGAEIYLLTDLDAPNWRIVASGPGHPGRRGLREVVAERDEPISMTAGSNAGQVVLHEDENGDPRLYVTYIQHNAHVIRIFDLDGEQVGEIELPFLGSVSSIQAEDGSARMLIGLTSFLVPHRIYEYDTRSSSFAPATGPWSTGDDAEAVLASYRAERSFFESKDGTRMPITVISEEGTRRDGMNQVLLYGYGGWGIPLLPEFSNRIHAWLAEGGVYALANLRGGGEYGVAWHDAGRMTHKQNVFDDFAAAAEYLVAEGWTTAPRLAILGASNGGLLTAASYNQRPELFGAVISEVAAIDLLRLPDTPVGATQTMELGAPSTSREVFEYLLGYSPLHNLREQGPFPPILHIVGENDPRCKPGHIYKYVADTQRWPAEERLSILRVVRGAGHGSQRKEDNVAWLADELSFAWEMTR